MTTRLLNRRQAHWSMFLSEFNFCLDFLPGTKNPADALSRHPNFTPQEGDDIVTLQHKALLTDTHLHHLFPATVPSPSISTLSTFSFDSSTLANQFKEAFRVDMEWREAVAKQDPLFQVDKDLVYYKGKLFVLESLCLDILHSRHDSIVAGHLKHVESFP
jgi:hypothetical protein